MPSDEYDSEHTHTFDKTINIYPDDNVEEKIKKFFIENEIKITKKISNEMYKSITNTRNLFEILEYKYITCIGSRICYYSEIYDMDMISNHKWYLINVWR